MKRAATLFLILLCVFLASCTDGAEFEKQSDQATKAIDVSEEALDTKASATAETDVPEGSDNSSWTKFY